jgi:hypothetical protein
MIKELRNRARIIMSSLDKNKMIKEREMILEAQANSKLKTKLMNEKK